MKPQLAVFREILCQVMAEKSVNRKLRWRQVLLEVIDCQKLKIARRQRLLHPGELYGLFLTREAHGMPAIGSQYSGSFKTLG